MAASRSSVTGWLRMLEPVLSQPVPPWVLRAMIIVGPIIMVRRWPLSILALWVAAIWFLPLLYRELLAARALHQETKTRVAAAEDALRREAEQRSYLERELQKVTAALRETESQLQKERQKPPSVSSGHPVFRRVGLDERAPKWLIAAAKREYRRRLHPDLHPAARKAEATRRFQECEAVFTDIERMRGFSET